MPKASLSKTKGRPKIHKWFHDFNLGYYYVCFASKKPFLTIFFIQEIPYQEINVLNHRPDSVPQ